MLHIYDGYSILVPAHRDKNFRKNKYCSDAGTTFVSIYSRPSDASRFFDFGGVNKIYE